MSEPFDTNEKEGKMGGREHRPGNIDYSSRKPWWLVVLIVIALLVFGVYIRNTNAPVAGQRENFWSLFKSDKSGLADSLSANQDALSSGNGPLAEVGPVEKADGAYTADGWETTETPDALPDLKENSSGQTTTSPTAPESPADVGPTSASSEITYRIIAGEFKDKKEATKRMQEIRQGNYPAQVIENPTGNYQVVAGEFKSMRIAESKAEALGFILEIKTRVEKKVN